MKKNFFRHYWAIISVTLALVIVNILLINSLFTQSFDSVQTASIHMNALQNTLAAPTVGQQIPVIPVTGTEKGSVFAGMLSSWFVWVTIGMSLLFILFFLLAQSGSNHS